MERTRLVLGLAVAFAGMTILLAVVAVALGQIFVVLVATPFAVVAYFFWYQATGRLRETVRSSQARGTAASGRGGFGAGPRGGWVPPREQRRRRREKRAHENYWRAQEARRDDTRAGPDPGTDRDRRTGSTARDPTVVEAYRVLGVEYGADETVVRDAYRDLVKEVHPDRGGDEDSFKRVTAAYERLIQE